ncbi:MAG: glycoside hydrolase family 43 protein [Pseudomonadota bacterium]
MPAPMLENPILPGFNPDPSICRVGDDFYIATSTFEWFPGVQIHHSRDLKHWRLVARPLNRPDLLNMLGEPDSCGVWAPCLTHANGRFYLLYTDVKRFDGNFKDTHNYLTSCATIDGDWDSPTYLNAQGFDPSLFHDDDGRTWVLNMVWDHRPDRSFFRGITLQEYSIPEGRLFGDVELIFDGTELDCTEGPHLYRFDDTYYLITAEGGTGYGHAVTMARSKSIHGPYEVDPAGPIVTAKDDPDWPLQRSGHADLVELEDGRFLLVHLASRPLPGTRRSPMGRESAIQELVRSEDGWFRLPDGDPRPRLEIRGVDAPPTPASSGFVDTDFDGPDLDHRFQWLRSPWPDELFSLTARPGHLRLFGRESIGSWYRQALVACRQTLFDFEIETTLDFEPASFQHLAGLTCYYNASKFHYLYVSWDPKLGKHLGMMSCGGRADLVLDYPAWDDRVTLPVGEPVRLLASVRGAELQFAFAVGDSPAQPFGPRLDYSVLCDEAGKGEGANFTGTFLGVCCQDLTGQQHPADFDRFSYRSGA